ncbi:unnamed protein product [Psylliodes chrysocephalus]|uniref:Uncharacterized protein n=1 Tax=Psylliodes chrysocephalus TaxID=3402493 RepID=A0A9P0G5W5_9CUCU|nr:unnamed protein product [Psylliodes chrysocephala]
MDSHTKVRISRHRTYNTARTDTTYKRTRNEETIILKPTEGKTYVDIIKSMKKEVDTKGVIVEKIPSKGEVQVTKNCNEEKTRQHFKELLKNKMETLAKVGTRQKRRTVMILDIDETTQENDVKQVIDT